MKNIYTTLIFLITINFASAQNWEWLNTGGGSSEGWNLESTIDKNDNIIFGGSYTTNSMVLGTDTLNTGYWGQNVAFLGKVNSSGTYLWTQQFDEALSIYIRGIETDGNGNIYVLGDYTFTGEVPLGFGNNITIGTQMGVSSGFLAKFTPGGTVLWAKDIWLNDAQTGNGITGKALTVDNIGNSYIAAEISGDSVHIDQKTLPNSNYGTGDDFFLLNFAPNGTLIKGLSTGLNTRDDASMGLTPQGNIVLTTQFVNDTVFIDLDTLVNQNGGTKEGIVVKLNTAFDVIWSKSFGSIDVDETMDLDIDNFGNIYIAGGFQGNGVQFTFGGTTITNNYFVQGFILKYDKFGNELNVITTSSPSGNEVSYFTNVDVINQNEIYATCLYDNDTTEMGSSSLPTPGYFNSFVARIESSGNALWMYNTTGTAPSPSDTTIFSTLEHDQEGNIYVGGWFSGGDISFGSNLENNTLTGPYDLFLARLANSCNLTLSFTINDAACGLNNGLATANVLDANGGSGPYNYQWTSGDSTQVADSLTSGIHQVVVTDSTTGCKVSGVAMVSDIGGATINVVGAGTNNVTCSGGNDGSIQINLIGGQSPLSVSWSNGNTTQNLTNLTAGPYDVTVEDDLGCITTRSIVITQPDAFNLSYSSTNAGCATTDGSANVHVEGSTAPYIYQWSSGGTDTTEINIGVGAYTFIVTDVNGCSDSIITMVNEANGPVITIDSVYTASCAVGNGGSVYISISGQAGPYTYQWSNGGGTNEDLVGVSPGLYTVMVSAANGCSSMTSGHISVELPENQAICLVTVDTTTGYNLVVWEKPIAGNISHYTIYQEQTQAGVYNLVGSVPYANISQFVDSLANPVVRSFRYKVGVVDTCGVESDLSWEHKTIHVVKSSFGGDNYLSWDNYEGFTYPSFNVWRYTDQTGWVNIYTLPSSLNSYTDLAPTGTNIDYFIEAVPNEICSATKAQDHNSTRSNRTSSITAGVVGVFEYNNVLVDLFPNPTKDRFQIRLSNGSVDKWSVEVYDISGKSIYHVNELSGNYYQIDLTDVESGIYLVRIQMGNKMVFRKVVKQ